MHSVYWTLADFRTCHVGRCSNQRDWTTVCHRMHSESTWFTSVRSLAETDNPGRAQTGTRLVTSPGVSDRGGRPALQGRLKRRGIHGRVRPHKPCVAKTDISHPYLDTGPIRMNYLDTKAFLDSSRRALQHIKSFFFFVTFCNF